MKYILNQDPIMLEGKQGGLLFQERRPVHNLQQRKYPLAARHITGLYQNKVIQTVEYFECRCCHERFSNYLLNVKERIGFSDSVR